MENIPWRDNINNRQTCIHPTKQKQILNGHCTSPGPVTLFTSRWINDQIVVRQWLSGKWLWRLRLGVWTIIDWILTAHRGGNKLIICNQTVPTTGQTIGASDQGRSKQGQSGDINCSKWPLGAPQCKPMHALTSQQPSSPKNVTEYGRRAVHSARH